MQPEHEAVVFLHAPAQRFHDLRARGTQPLAGEIGELLRIAFAGDDGVEKRTAAGAQDVADDPDDLDVGVLERLLDALLVARELAHELLARAREVA